jgi:hypothetical protein
MANVLNEEQLVPHCPTNTSCPPLIRHANRKQRTPFIDVRNWAKLELTDEELVERFIAYNKDLGDQPNCIRKTYGKQKSLNCSCLSILNSSTSITTNLYQKAVAHFQFYFGKLEKHQQRLRWGHLWWMKIATPSWLCIPRVFQTTSKPNCTVTIGNTHPRSTRISHVRSHLRQGPCGGGPFCDHPSGPQQYFLTKLPTELQLGSRPAEIHVFVNFPLREVCTISLSRHYCSSTLRYVRQVLLPTKKNKLTSSRLSMTADHGVWPLDFNNKNRLKKSSNITI